MNPVLIWFSIIYSQLTVMIIAIGGTSWWLDEKSGVIYCETFFNHAIVCKSVTISLLSGLLSIGIVISFVRLMKVYRSQK